MSLMLVHTLPVDLAVEGRRLLAQEQAPLVRDALLTAPRHAIVLTPTRLLLLRTKGFRTEGTAVPLTLVTKIDLAATPSGMDLVVRYRPRPDTPEEAATILVEARRRYRVAEIVNMARGSQAYGLDLLTADQRQSRLQGARSELLGLLTYAHRHRTATPLNLVRFTGLRELTLLYGDTAHAKDDRGPRALPEVTYLSGIPAFETWLQQKNTVPVGFPQLSDRHVKFDDLGPALLVRIGSPLWYMRHDLSHGLAVHLRHDTITSVLIRENARAAVVDETINLSGGFVGARLLGPFGAAAGGMSGTSHAEIAGSAVLTIAAEANGHEHRTNFAVKALELDPVRYYFHKLYGERLTFIEEGTTPPTTEEPEPRTQDLATLTELRHKGILTDEEYEAAKKRLLA